MNALVRWGAFLAAMLGIASACSSAPGGKGRAGTGGGAMASGGSSSGGATASGGSSSGGAPASGGAAGTAGGGGGVSGGACRDSSLVFCEDFEGAAAGAATSPKWTNDMSTGASAGTLTIDGMHSRGQAALHVHVAGNGHAMIHVKNFSAPANSFHGRLWLWADAFPTAPNYAHFTMVEAAGTGNSSKVRPIGGQYISGSMGSFWGAGSDGGPTGDWTSWKTSAPTKAQAWVCMQWQMDASKNAITISIDGTPQPDLSVSTKMNGGTGDFVFPTFNDIWFGWWLYQAGPTPDHFDIWLDDLALGTAAIPCESR